MYRAKWSGDSTMEVTVKLPAQICVDLEDATWTLKKQPSEIIHDAIKEYLAKRNIRSSIGVVSKK